MESEYFFSLLLVVRNEEKYIRQTLECILHQDFPRDQYEIIVVDGHSSDRTPDIIQLYVRKYPSRITYLQNPKETLPTGWNLAIKRARGEYVVRVDGHSEIPDHFLARTYEVIQRVPDAACVGGVVRTEGKGFWGEVNAYVYSHPFGVGNSKFRTAKGQWEGYVDTVPYGAYKRSVFDEVGYFDESLKRNEDLEMHARIRRSGGRFFLSTRIQSVYYTRHTLRGLIKKSLDDGKWTFIAARRRMGVLRLRHKMPLFALLLGLTLAIASFVSIWGRYALLTLATAYAFLLVYSAWGLARRKGARYFLPCAITFFFLHISRGLGSVLSFFSREYWRKAKANEKKRNSRLSDASP